MNLTNDKLDKLWECITFKEFLDDKASIDEIYYYCYCRHLLFKGP